MQPSDMRDVGTAEQPAMLFADGDEFRTWLTEHHATHDGLWVALAKKHVAEPKLDWPRAVREALCFGWIDSQAKRLEGASGPGVTQDSRARRPARCRTSRMGRPRTASARAVQIARPVSQPAVDVSNVYAPNRLRLSSQGAPGT